MDKTGLRIREEKEWYRYYTSSAHPYIYESKFATGEATVSLAELQSRWHGWNEAEQVQFACKRIALNPHVREEGQQAQRGEGGVSETLADPAL